MQNLNLQLKIFTINNHIYIQINNFHTKFISVS